MKKSVFAGLKVLDLSWGIAGPMATMLLADAGADVVKIEPPGGDPFRFLLGYHVWNRGKRSITLDLKNDADRDVFLKLAEDADILIESYGPGTADRLGVNYEKLASRNPRLIYGSITAYGDTADAHRHGYDALVAARCGVHWEQRGWLEGQMNHMRRIPDPYPDLEISYDWLQGPPRPGPVFASTCSSSLGAFYSLTTGIHAALCAREKTGEGQRIDTSLMQGALAALNGSWQRGEHVDTPGFNTWVYGGKSPKGHFKTSDGRWIHQWVPNPRFIIQASEGDQLDTTPDLSVQNDPDRFGIGPEEILVMAHYQPLLAERIAKFTADQWVEAAAKADVPLQEARSPERALTDPIYLKEGNVVTLDDPELGKINGVGIVIELEKTPGAVQGPAPRVNQHDAEIRKEASGPRRTHEHVTKPVRLSAPLAGIRVLDLGLAVAGPFGTMVLSDLGAEVIKVNALHDAYWHNCHIAMCNNRGKRSISMNLKDPRCLKILHELVRTADVVQHNMRYDAAERLGVDFESLKQINPRIVYCHTRGFDRVRMGRPGNDQTGACMAGNQYEDGGIANGGKPLWPFSSFGDVGNGYLSAFGIMQALYHRDRTGEAQRVGTSIVNAQLLNCSFVAARPDGSGFDRPRLDKMQMRVLATYGLYEAADGWLCVAALTDKDWAGLAAILPPAFSAPRFATREGRAAADMELRGLLEEVFKQHTVAEWKVRFERGNVTAEVTNPEFGRNLHDDPEMQRRGWVVSFEMPRVGRLDQIGDCFTLSKTPTVMQGRPVIVGRETKEILSELGHREQQIQELIDAKVVLSVDDGVAVRNVLIKDKWTRSKPQKGAAA